jgi:hypothetical protein
LEHCPHWRTICESEEEFARLAGKSLDFSEAVPYGLGTIDRDAVDPCTRAWLELLRLESHAFRIFSYGTQTIRGTAYPTVGGTIDDLCGASAAYGKRRARDEIGSRLMEPSAQRKFEKTPEWQRYLDGLPELAELPAAREIPGHTEALPSKPQPQRKAVVLPILQRRGMSRSRWATKAGVDPSVVYDYLEKNSHPRPENRKALAEAIGLSAKDLPE